jgi:hypothetical protein
MCNLEILKDGDTRAQEMKIAFYGLTRSFYSINAMCDIQFKRAIIRSVREWEEKIQLRFCFRWIDCMKKENIQKIFFQKRRKLFNNLFDDN